MKYMQTNLVMHSEQQMNMLFKFIFICLKLGLHHSYVTGMCIAHCIQVSLNLYVCIHVAKILP